MEALETETLTAPTTLHAEVIQEETMTEDMIEMDTTEATGTTVKAILAMFLINAIMPILAPMPETHALIPILNMVLKAMTPNTEMKGALEATKRMIDEMTEETDATTTVTLEELKMVIVEMTEAAAAQDATMVAETTIITEITAVEAMAAEVTIAIDTTLEIEEAMITAEVTIGVVALEAAVEMIAKVPPTGKTTALINKMAVTAQTTRRESANTTMKTTVTCALAAPIALVPIERNFCSPRMPTTTLTKMVA